MEHKLEQLLTKRNSLWSEFEVSELYFWISLNFAELKSWYTEITDLYETIIKCQDMIDYHPDMINYQHSVSQDILLYEENVEQLININYSCIQTIVALSEQNPNAKYWLKSAYRPTSFVDSICLTNRSECMKQCEQISTMQSEYTKQFEPEIKILYSSGIEAKPECELELYSKFHMKCKHVKF